MPPFSNQLVYTQQHAELLISQDALERKVSQMKFLISFYEKTRFMLERERIAEEFLRLVCGELGFMIGLSFSGKSGQLARLDTAVDLDAGTSVTSQIRRKFSMMQIGTDGKAALFLYDSSNRAFPQLAEIYNAAGVPQPYNSAVIELSGSDGDRLQLHAVNWKHGPLFDPSTTELLQTMLPPLESTFYTASLYQSSITDELTQLKNRRYFQICVDRDIELCRKTEKPLSLILVDLDHFKKINDSFGHRCGDEVLKNAALVLRSNLRKDATIARWGGEEFVILLPGVEHDQAMQIAEKLRLLLCEQTVPYPDGFVRYSASFGVSSITPQCASSESLIALADSALYECKRNGRNRIGSGTG